MFTHRGLAIVIVGLLVVGLWWFFTLPSKTSSVSKAPIPAAAMAPTPASAPTTLDNANMSQSLTARVRTDGERLYIENADSADWSHCSFDMNFLGNSGYSYKYLDVALQATGVINLNEFAKGDGGRFDPKTQKLQSLYVGCDTPAGKRSWAGHFGQ